jgi:hypothetical protein
MSSLDAYLATVRDRMLQDGCTVTDEVIGPVQATMGYRSNVKALSKVHLFTAVAGVRAPATCPTRPSRRGRAQPSRSRCGAARVAAAPWRGGTRPSRGAPR